MAAKPLTAPRRLSRLLHGSGYSRLIPARRVSRPGVDSIIPLPRTMTAIMCKRLNFGTIFAVDAIERMPELDQNH